MSDGNDFSSDVLSEIAGEDGPSLSERIMAFAGDNSEFMVVSNGQGVAAGEADAGDADLRDDSDDDVAEGLVTPSDDDSDADQDDGDSTITDGQEADEATEGKKGVKQKTWEERQAEIEARVLERLRQEQQAATAGTQLDFIPNIDRAKVDEYIAEVENKIDELRLEGNYSEARKLSRSLDQLEADIEANEARKAAYIQSQESSSKLKEQAERERIALNNTADAYRIEHQIDEATWKKMGDWFEEQVKASPILQQEFNEIYERRGRVGAIRFAHEYVVQKLGNQARVTTEKREQSKSKTAALTTASTSARPNSPDLKKARAEFAANPTPEAFARFQEAKRRAAA